MRYNIILSFAAAFVSVSTPACSQSVEFVAKFRGEGVAGSDWFGVAVALDGTIALIGARESTENGKSSGAAYLLDTTIGTQTKLIPADNAGGDWFGGSVAIDGANALIGGVTSGRFGLDVALDNSIAIIGAPGDMNGVTRNGSAYIFDTVSGAQIAKLTAPDGAEHDNFGSAVALNGSIAIIGARLDDDSGSGSGSAYLFDIDTLTLIAKIRAPNGAEGKNFGISVAASGDLFLVGSLGEAYLFRLVNDG